MINAICNKCHTHFLGDQKKTFLGFHKLVCPSCNATITYPLTSEVRIFYAIAFVAGLVLLGYLVFKTNYTITGPAFVGCAILFALLKDVYVRHRIAKSAERSPVKGA